MNTLQWHRMQAGGLEAKSAYVKSLQIVPRLTPQGEKFYVAMKTTNGWRVSTNKNEGEILLDTEEEAQDLADKWHTEWINSLGLKIIGQDLLGLWSDFQDMCSHPDGQFRNTDLFERESFGLRLSSAAHRLLFLVEDTEENVHV